MSVTSVDQDDALAAPAVRRQPLATANTQFEMRVFSLKILSGEGDPLHLGPWYAKCPNGSRDGNVRSPRVLEEPARPPQGGGATGC